MAPPFDRVRGFPNRWVLFWNKLVIVAASEPFLALYDDTLMDRVVEWLDSVSRSPVRSWRKTATVAAFAVMDSLIEVTHTLNKRIQVVEAQMADKRLAKTVSKHTITVRRQQRHLAPGLRLHLSRRFHALHLRRTRPRLHFSHPDRMDSCARRTRREGIPVCRTSKVCFLADRPLPTLFSV